MPATFHIEERASGLLVSVTEPGNYGRVALIAALGSVVGYFFLRAATSTALRIAVCLFLLFVLIKDAISSLRGTAVQLQIGNLDLLSKGHAPGGYSPSTISRADIERFEYRSAGGGGDCAEWPEGLYAEWKGFGPWPSSRCILPGVSQDQADAVIEAIYKRYSDTGTFSPIIGLNLSSSKKP
jgi:hypothetical protein